VKHQILVTGNGKSGSWKIRGEQLGEAIGAAVTPTPKHIAGLDRVVVVKHYMHPAIHEARRAAVPVILDVVDAWQSRLGNDRGRAASKAWLDDVMTLARPRGIVAATRAMATDCESYGLPVLALPHHARPGMEPNPIRPEVRRVGYEGSEKYLGWWRAAIADECAKRGWEFVINPPQLAEVDIVLAVRDEGGYPARHWKSNVKLANAQGSGTPVVVNREMGYLETASGVEHWADDIGELRLAFDALTSHEARLHAHRRLREATITLAQVAKTYRGWLCASSF
jgi:hypothetical protein